jgi:hypothetical protein
LFKKGDKNGKQELALAVLNFGFNVSLTLIEQGFFCLGFNGFNR